MGRRDDEGGWGGGGNLTRIFSYSLGNMVMMRAMNEEGQ